MCLHQFCQLVAIRLVPFSVCQIKGQRQNVASHIFGIGFFDGQNFLLDGLLHLGSIVGIERAVVLFSQYFCNLPQHTHRLIAKERRNIPCRFRASLKPRLFFSRNQPLAKMEARIPQIAVILIRFGTAAAACRRGDKAVPVFFHGRVKPLQHICIACHLVHVPRQPKQHIAPPCHRRQLVPCHGTVLAGQNILQPLGRGRCVKVAPHFFKHKIVHFCGR